MGNTYTSCALVPGGSVTNPSCPTSVGSGNVATTLQSCSLMSKKKSFMNTCILIS